MPGTLPKTPHAMKAGELHTVAFQAQHDPASVCPYELTSSCSLLPHCSVATGTYYVVSILRSFARAVLPVYNIVTSSFSQDDFTAFSFYLKCSIFREVISNYLTWVGLSHPPRYSLQIFYSFVDVTAFITICNYGLHCLFISLIIIFFLKWAGMVSAWFTFYLWHQADYLVPNRHSINMLDQWMNEALSWHILPSTIPLGVLLLPSQHSHTCNYNLWRNATMFSFSFLYLQGTLNWLINQILFVGEKM